MKKAIEINQEVAEYKNHKIHAAKKGFCTKVKSVSSGHKSYFVDLREVSKEEFELVADFQSEYHQHVNQYLNGRPAVWDVTYYSKKTDSDESAKFISEHFINFLRERHLISVRGLERAVGMPNDTIRTAMKPNPKQRIPEKYFYRLGLELSKYGFDWPENEE